MKMHRIVPLLYALSALATLSLRAMAQEPAGTGSSSVTVSASQETMPEQPVPTYVRPTEKTKLHNYLFDAFGPYPIAGAVFVAGIDQAKTSPPRAGVGARRWCVRQARWVQLRRRRDNDDNALWSGGSFPARRVVLPVRVQRGVSTTGACRDFDADRTPRRRWPSRLLCPRPRFSICGHDDRGLRIVSEPLRLQGCLPDGQLHPNVAFCAKRRNGIPLWRTTLVAFSQPSQ